MLPALLLASTLFTPQQVTALNQAYAEGSLYGIGKTFMAVVMVESSACINVRGDDGTSWGCGQLKVATARTICRCRITPRRLVSDKYKNLQISAQFLANCFQRFYPDSARATICYNIGEPKAATLTNSEVAHSKYVARVKAWLKILKAIPVDYD